MTKDITHLLRIPLLMLGMISLVVGVLAGLGRMGWPVPSLGLSQIPNHAVLMIPAFFGAVIGLERAVAIGKSWAYLGSLFSGLGGVLLVFGASNQVAYLSILLGGLVFFVASIKVLVIQKALHNWILLMGAVALLIGNLLLILNIKPLAAVLWWMVFLVLTIAGERLELSRLAIRSDAKRQLLALLCLMTFLGALIGIFSYSTGELATAIGIFGVALWLISYDIARRTVRQASLPRFTAVCMLTGYAWMLLCALLIVLTSLGLIDIARDAALHTLFLGFVFSMVLGHALIIFPAVTRLRIPYTPLIYLPLALLHGTLLLRVIGTLTVQAALYRWGGMLNAVALAMFILVMVFAIYKGLRTQE